MSNTRFDAVVLIVVLVLAGISLQYAFVEGAESNAVENEELAVNIGSTSNVSQDGIRYSEEVNITINGTTAEEGESYDWDHRNGGVTWLNSPTTEGEDSATIAYSVEQVDEQTTELSSLYSILVFAVGLLLALVLVTGALQTVRDTWGL